MRKLLPEKRFAYLSRRADQWIGHLRDSFPYLSVKVRGESTNQTRRRWSNLPTTLEVHCNAKELLEIANTAGVGSIYISKIAGFHPRRGTKPTLEWYCVRALVVIRVEGATSGLQSTEDRFVLLRASSFEDAEKGLAKQWIEYASPYLNSNGRIVSWQLDHVVDVYQTSETEIDPAGTEVYSKLNGRRMLPAYVWHPSRTGQLLKPKH